MNSLPVLFIFQFRRGILVLEKTYIFPLYQHLLRKQILNVYFFRSNVHFLIINVYFFRFGLSPDV